MTIEMYDDYGRIDLSRVSDSAVEALSDEQRAAFLNCIEAAKATEAGEQRVRDAERDVYQKMHEHSKALAADAIANPPQDPIAALRAVIAANAKR